MAEKQKITIREDDLKNIKCSSGRSYSIQYKKIKQILILVPGTTDPINMRPYKNEADESYWKYFELTDKSFTKLREKGVPEEVIRKLDPDISKLFKMKSDDYIKYNKDAPETETVISKLVMLKLKGTEYQSKTKFLLDLELAIGKNDFEKYCSVIVESAYKNTPFLDKIYDLKKQQFPDLRILDNFSWSGDNTKDEREKAGQKLWDLLKRVYSNWLENQKVYLHFIGHSHGGAVINEFTKAISKSGDFPEKWKIRSITYLSTPFFTELHRVDTTHFDPGCKIINVFNKYDITQRVIADYTLTQLTNIVSIFNRNKKIKEAFHTLITEIENFDFENFKEWYYINSHYRPLWSYTLPRLEILSGIIEDIKDIIIELSTKYPYLMSKSIKEQICSIMEKLLTWKKDAVISLNQRLDKYNASRFKPIYDLLFGLTEYFQDIKISDPIKIINDFIIFHKRLGNEHIPISKLIDIFIELLLNQFDRGIIDDTASPEEMVPPEKPYCYEKFRLPEFYDYDYEPIEISKRDLYDKKRKEREYNNFIEKLENIQKKYILSKNEKYLTELIWHILSQLTCIKSIVNEIIKGSSSFKIKIANILYGLDKKEIDTFNDIANEYYNIFSKYDANLVDKKDLDNDNLKCEDKPGSIIYLTYKSHNLSIYDLYPEVKDALIIALDIRRKKESK